MRNGIVMMEDWSIEKSRIVYGLNRNDLHFLDITEDGKLCIKLGSESISLKEIIERVKEGSGETAGYTSSFTLRLPQLVTYQINRLKQAFGQAKKKLGYHGDFLAVYPIKVNQRRDIVSAVIASDSEYGLEVGTKAELALIRTVLGKERHRRIVCNGAKDPEYLDMIQEFINEEFHMAVSIESVHEAQIIVERFDPSKTDLVLRIKPYITVEGHWSHSTGRDSKFGLSIHDIYDVVRLLKDTAFSDSVSTILAHVGSQITDIDSFRRFGKYMAEIYILLREMGLVNLRIIDFGGGLAIDYTSANPPDLLEQYAHELVAGIQSHKSDWSEEEIPHILVEAGRGITALSSLVLVNALEIRSVFPKRENTSADVEKRLLQLTEQIESSQTLEDLAERWNSFHEELTRLTGDLSVILENEQLLGLLEDRVREKLIQNAAQWKGFVPKDISLRRDFWHPEYIAIGNFSVFNAIGDWVLVNQHFPIVPIQDLDVLPETTVRLVDITCDSDGEFSQFFRQHTDNPWFTKDNRPVSMPGSEMGEGIPVGILDNVQGSYFVIALTGAYQDVIEMNHNLLGDLPDVQLILTDTGTWKLLWIEGAEPIDEILKEQGYLDLDIDQDPYMSDNSAKD